MIFNINDIINMEKYIETLKIARNHANENQKGLSDGKWVYYKGKEEGIQYALEQFFELKMDAPYLKELKIENKQEKKETIETIFDGKTCVIPMDSVQHYEKYWRKNEEKKYNNYNGIHIITDKTKWSLEKDCWENAIYLDREEADEFMKCFMRFRFETGNSKRYWDLIGEESNKNKESLDFIKKCRDYFYYRNLDIHSHLTPTIKELLEKSEEILKNNNY